MPKVLILVESALEVCADLAGVIVLGLDLVQPCQLEGCKQHFGVLHLQHSKACVPDFKPPH
jgi:hypothetical protein